MVFAGALAAAVSTNAAELTAAGLAYRFNFRRKLIPWTSIESFRIARGPGTGPWSGLVVQLSDGNSVLVSSVVGTKRYVEHVIAETEAFRMHLEPAVVSKPGMRRKPGA